MWIFFGERNSKESGNCYINCLSALSITFKADSCCSKFSTLSKRRLVLEIVAKTNSSCLCQNECNATASSWKYIAIHNLAAGSLRRLFCPRYSVNAVANYGNSWLFQIKYKVKMAGKLEIYCNSQLSCQLLEALFLSQIRCHCNCERFVPLFTQN